MFHCGAKTPHHSQMGAVANLYVTPIQNNLSDNTDLNGFTHHTDYKYAYNDGDGSTYYDIEYTLQLSAFDPNFHNTIRSLNPPSFSDIKDKYPMLNGRGYPDTIDPNILYNTAADEGLIDKPSQKINSLITATQGEKILLRLSCLSTNNYYTIRTFGIPAKVIAKGAKLLRGPDGKDLSYHTSSVTLGSGQSTDIILDTTDITPGTYFLYTTNLNYLSNNNDDFGGMMTEIRINAMF